MPTLHPEERIWLDEYRQALVEQQPGAVARLLVLLVWIEKPFSFSRSCVPYGGGVSATGNSWGFRSVPATLP